MTYIGDLVLGQLVHHTWTSRSFTTSQPATLTGGTVAIYKDDNIAEHLGGIALTTDFDGRTGLNNVRLSALDGQGFYNAGEDYAATLIAGTVDGVDVTGEVIFTFSISNRNVLGLSTQEIRDAMKLDPSTGLPGPDSIDSKIDSRSAPGDAMNASQIAGSTPAADAVRAVYADIISRGTLTAVTDASTFNISDTTKPIGYYVGGIIQFDTGPNAGVQGRRIASYDNGTGLITTDNPFTTLPTNGDQWTIFGYIP